MRIGLFQPDIPQNTGTILRLAACLDVPVDIIGPAGFDLSDRALKRSGLDYLECAALVHHASWSDYLSWHDGGRQVAHTRGDAPGRLILCTTKADQPYTSFAFAPADTILMGRESAGAPDYVHDAADARIRIPMIEGVRSLNMAIATAMVLGEALRQVDGFPV